MCNEAMNVATGDYYDSIGELKALAGGSVKWPTDNGDHLPDNNCLCWVNIPATLVEAGYRVWRNPNMVPTYLFDRPE